MSALGSARLSVIMQLTKTKRRGPMRSRTFGFGGCDGREWHYVLGLLWADCAGESLAIRQLSFTTLDVRHNSAWNLGVTDGIERDQRHEDRGTAPASNRR